MPILACIGAFVLAAAATAVVASAGFTAFGAFAGAAVVIGMLPSDV